MTSTVPTPEATEGEAPRLGFPQFLGYAAGDAANNLAFSMSSAFLLLYYTDVAGISAAAVATLFLLVRIFDAFADIFAGRVVDRTMTRWGKFRPFFLFGAVPVLGLSVAVFSVPSGLGSTATLVYAYVTYAALGLAYSLVNIPYGSLASAMTQRPDERAKLASYRMIGTATTIIMLAFVVAPQIEGSKADPAQFQRSLTITTAIFLVVGVGLYLFLFKTSRETVHREVDHVTMRQSFETLRHNKPLLMLCGGSLLFLLAMFSLQSVQAFYARDVLGNANYLIILTILSAGAIFAIAPLIPRMVKVFGKKKSFIIFGVIGIVGAVGITLSPPTQPVLAIISFGIMGIAIAGVNTLMWALEADTVEYGERRTGVRTEGITYALFSFTRKLGQALGGAVAGFVIAAGGYTGDVLEQSESALWSIRLAAGLIPAGFMLLAIAVIFFYPLTEKFFTEMVAETKARRTAHVPPPDDATST